MDTNRLLALIRQELEAVLKITHLEELNLSMLPASQAQIVRDKLREIDISAKKVREKLRSEVSRSEVPLFSGSGALLQFYEREYIPRKELIHNISTFGDAKGLDLDELLAELGLPPSNPKSSQRKETPLKDALELAVERLDDFLHYSPPEHLEHMVDEGLDDLKTILAASFVEPDEWLENLNSLRPIASKRGAEMLPKHVRVRIKEIYRSYIFGNWQSVAAMSRTVLEYALIDRASSLGYQAYEKDQNGKLRPISLRRLVDQASESLPEVSKDMNAIREYGNEVMHPEKTKKLRTLPLSRFQAMDCIERVKRSLGAVYA